MYDEADLLPLSGLQHLVFCRRQCALIHVEKAWRNNALTAEGTLLHSRVDSEKDERRGDLRITRSLALRSLRLGLAGRADVVEFHRLQPHPSSGVPSTATALPGLPGVWRPVPIEYKHGGPKWSDCDRVQLCAQAMCLEEMLEVNIPEGLLYYGRHRRRFEVIFGPDLRQKTIAAAIDFHEMMRLGQTPGAAREPKCEHCSLLDLCMPRPRKHRLSASAYLRQEIDNSMRIEPS